MQNHNSSAVRFSFLLKAAGALLLATIAAIALAAAMSAFRERPAGSVEEASAPYEQPATHAAPVASAAAAATPPGPGYRARWLGSGDVKGQGEDSILRMPSDREVEGGKDLAGVPLIEKEPVIPSTAAPAITRGTRRMLAAGSGPPTTRDGIPERDEESHDEPMLSIPEPVVPTSFDGDLRDLPQITDADRQEMRRSLSTPKGTLAAGMLVTPNATEPGHLVISAFQATEITGAGTLINLKFTVTGAPGRAAVLSFTDHTDQNAIFHPAARFNAGQPSAVTIKGRVNILGPSSGDSIWRRSGTYGGPFSDLGILF